MNVLLSFVGFHDPYSRGLVGEQDQPGPILSLLEARKFNKVVLFATPNTDRLTDETSNTIKARHSNIDVMALNVPLSDPTDYKDILGGLRAHLRTIQDACPGGHFFVGVNSGTPQMHASWILLVASGEITAHLLSIRPPRFVEKGLSLITEVDLTSPAFPTVRRGRTVPDTGRRTANDFATAIEEIGLVADHPSMKTPLDTVEALASSNVPILILGETGTGKELFAQLVHLLSGRARDRFVAVNCAAIPEPLIESMLFGHKRGAFTGATSDQVGKFDLADGGTLFLDELVDLPLPAQAKLLRVLQDGIVEPLGAKRGRKVDVRVVAATNRPVRYAIKKGHFREDLYYRLDVGRLDLPPLRERPSDIPKITLHILDRVNRTLRHPKRLSVDALARMQNHTWPGNVRDLENVIERSARLARSEILDAEDLLIAEPITKTDALDALPDPHEGFSIEVFLSGARNQLMLRALEIADGNQSGAARLLGISPQAVHKFLRSKTDSINHS